MDEFRDQSLTSDSTSFSCDVVLKSPPKMIGRQYIWHWKKLYNLTEEDHIIANLHLLRKK